MLVVSDGIATSLYGSLLTCAVYFTNACIAHQCSYVVRSNTTTSHDNHLETKQNHSTSQHRSAVRSLRPELQGPHPIRVSMCKATHIVSCYCHHVFQHCRTQWRGCSLAQSTHKAQAHTNHTTSQYMRWMREACYNSARTRPEDKIRAMPAVRQYCGTRLVSAIMRLQTNFPRCTWCRDR